MTTRPVKVWDGSAWISVGVLAPDTTNYVINTRTLTAGSGLTGGGDLSADRTLSIASGGVTNAMVSSTAAIDVGKLSGVMSGDGTALGSGRWIASGSPTGTNAYINTLAVGLPFIINRTMTFDRIGVETTVAGSAGALLRLGVYKLTGTTVTREFDAGTVDATAAAGLQTITINKTLTPGVYIGFVACQGAPATAPTTRFGVSNHVIGLGMFNASYALTGSSAKAAFYFYESGAFGSSYDLGELGSAPLLHLRTA